jgi:hypothetical protein
VTSIVTVFVIVGRLSVTLFTPISTVLCESCQKEPLSCIGSKLFSFVSYCCIGSEVQGGQNACVFSEVTCLLLASRDL